MQTTENPPITGSVLAIDPGGSGKGETGIVWLALRGDVPPHIFDSWAVPNGLEGFREWATSSVGHFPLHTADFVVCETFVNRNILGADLTLLLIEGAVRFVRADTVLQPAAGKNTAVPDKALANLGMLNIGKSDHHRDRREAARHAVWYLKKRGHMPTIRAGWPPQQGAIPTARKS